MAVLGDSFVGPTNDDSMAFIYANWSINYRSTEEDLETALGLVTEGFIVVSDCMLICILFISVEPLEMSYTEAADTLASPVGNLKAEGLPSSLHLLCFFKQFNLS